MTYIYCQWWCKAESIEQEHMARLWFADDHDYWAIQPRSTFPINSPAKRALFQRSRDSGLGLSGSWHPLADVIRLLDSNALRYVKFVHQYRTHRTRIMYSNCILHMKICKCFRRIKLKQSLVVSKNNKMFTVDYKNPAGPAPYTDSTSTPHYLHMSPPRIWPRQNDRQSNHF